CLA
ncbi:pyridine nucleotide-disulfide oxidoreductase family protein, partial [Vibrio parahaemolyticus V-223/04]